MSSCMGTWSVDTKILMATSILTRPPALIRFFNCFYGVWDPSNQLEAELASNLPRELRKMVEYGLEFTNFRFGAWPTASGHGEYIYIYLANGSVRKLIFAGPTPPALKLNFAGPKIWEVKTDAVLWRRMCHENVTYQHRFKLSAAPFALLKRNQPHYLHYLGILLALLKHLSCNSCSIYNAHRHWRHCSHYWAIAPRCVRRGSDQICVRLEISAPLGQWTATSKTQVEFNFPQETQYHDL